MLKLSNLCLALCLVLLLGASCSSGSAPDGKGASTSATNSNTASANKNDYPVFVNPDAGADPAVPADQGGKGFAGGQGWETNTNFELVGDPRAVKGGLLRDHMISFPGTLRMAGPEWNNEYNYVVNTLVYESLVGLHPETLEYVPSLATHWKVDPDKLTFHFRIDPNARFSDGTPVTAEDVVASWKFLTDKTLDDLYNITQFGKLEVPVAESKYIVRFKAKELGWENFMIASGMRIFPARLLKDITGSSYLKDYNFKLLPGTGPYILSEADIEKGKSITIRRRKDYWAEKYRANVGQYNFDEYKLSVVRDENLAWEMLKKGELDYYYVNRPEVWMEQTNTDAFQRGILLKRAVFNNTPADNIFIAFNTRRKPWDDIRVRKALTMLLNRQQIIEKLYYNIFVPSHSFFSATVYENPGNPKNLYDPQAALALLAEAGWKDRDAQGRLTKNGQPLQADLMYANKTSEKWLTVYQEDLRKAGITLNLHFLTFETQFKMEMQREFEMASGAWGAGGVFPEPRPEFHSETADRNNTNNISGFKNKLIDKLCEQYELEFDSKKRTEMLKELDSLLTNEYQYILRWYDPATRIVYSNRFGMPKGTFSRVGDYFGTVGPGIPQLWWIDPAKSEKFDRAMRDPSVKLDIPPVEDHYWQEKYGNAQKEMEAQTKKP
jgi:microcin C transport system substrate-binding protein